MEDLKKPSNEEMARWRSRIIQAKDTYGIHLNSGSGPAIRFDSTNYITPGLGDVTAQIVNAVTFGRDLCGHITFYVLRPSDRTGEEFPIGDEGLYSVLMPVGTQAEKDFHPYLTSIDIVTGGKTIKYLGHTPEEFERITAWKADPAPLDLYALSSQIKGLTSNLPLELHHAGRTDATMIAGVLTVDKDQKVFREVLSRKAVPFE